MDRLQASLDKGFASQLRYEQIVDRVNSAMERGRISQERGAQIISLAQQRYMAAATATAAMGAATSAASTSSRQFGFVAQQSGYQLGDFAVQVASGQSAMVAFIQQGSQFLGIFGAFGAVAGAALAIGGGIYMMFSRMAENAKAATDEVSSLTEEIKRMNEESAKRGRGQTGIRANVRLEGLMAERNRLSSMMTTGGGGAAATSEMQGFVEAQAASEVARIQSQIDAIDKLIREYDRLVMEQERVDESTANLKRRGEEFEEQKKREAEAVRDAARAQEEAERARQRFLSDVMSLENTLDPLTAATRRWADQQALLAQALDAAIISQERYNELVAASDEAFRKATEKQTEYLTGIERQTRQNENLARDLGFTFQSAFEDAILRGEKLRGVLAGIAQDLARIVMRQTVTTPLASMLMGGLSSAFGGLFGGSSLGDIRGPGGSTSIPFGGPRALGGPVETGSAYLVGEQGPELFMPGQSGRIIPNGQTGGTVVNQTINISVGVAQTVRAEIAALMPAIKRQTVDAVADARMRGGTFAAAMGT
jgi:DNA repair exonuclease SbcCD ATPase subunit